MNASPRRDVCNCSLTLRPSPAGPAIGSHGCRSTEDDDTRRPEVSVYDTTAVVTLPPQPLPRVYLRSTHTHRSPRLYNNIGCCRCHGWEGRTRLNPVDLYCITRHPPLRVWNRYLYNIGTYYYKMKTFCYNLFTTTASADASRVCNRLKRVLLYFVYRTIHIDHALTHPSTHAFSPPVNIVRLFKT